MSAPGPRAEARKKGLTHYFGKICEKHPDQCGERITSNGRCIACLKRESKKYIKSWKRKNKERVNAQRRTDEQRAKQNARLKKREVRDRANARDREKRQTNIQYALRRRLGSVISNYLGYHRIRKTGRTFELIGCTVSFLIEHLERQFLPGMSWDNRVLWHIDHIRPISSFDLTDPAQQRACWHYSNLQPLWGYVNIALKRDKLDYQLTEADKLPPI